MALKAAIVGRPNVGKSTLFNRLVGRKLALVDDQPGVTRDRREGDARIGDLAFTLVDTAGLDYGDQQSLAERMRVQTETAVAEADVSLFMIDMREGVTAVDRHFAQRLRRSGKPVILLANKTEGRAGMERLNEAYELGLGEPIAVSAEHGEGLSELYDALRGLDGSAEPTDEVPDDEGGERPIRLAIVGQPNAGKSTLVNAMLGEERMLTSAEPGTTRDSIATDLSYRDKEFRIWDTAGLRKKARVAEKLEKLSIADALRAVRFSEVVVLLIDATVPFEKQDLRIADIVAEEGRALVIALNKWDLVEDPARRRRELMLDLEETLTQVSGVALVTVSALQGKGLDRLLDEVLKAYEVWNKRVSTAALNRWLASAVERHPPPAPGGRRIKLRYMTQSNARPPTFVVFCSNAADVPRSYVRYLVNGLRTDFGFAGVPIRLNLRRGRNPFAERSKGRGHRS
jgi:GTP-binding protein